MGHPEDEPSVELTEADIFERASDLVDEDDIIGGPVHIMYERLTQDDYDGALLVAHGILAREPGHLDAIQCRAICETELSKLYVARVGALDRVPQLSLEVENPSRRPLDPGSEQVLGLVDGLKPVSEIMERSSLGSFETLRSLSELYLRLLIEFEDE